MDLSILKKRLDTCNSSSLNMGWREYFSFHRCSMLLCQKGRKKDGGATEAGAGADRHRGFRLRVWWRLEMERGALNRGG